MLNVRQIFILVFIAAIIGLSKQVYGTIMLLYFLIPSARMGNRKRYFAFGIILLCVCLASSLIWIYFSTSRYNAVMSLGIDANIEGQIKFIAENPLRTLFILFRSNLLQAKSYASTFIGILGWYFVRFPLWFYFVYMFILVKGAMHGKLKISSLHRIIMLSGLLATLFALDAYMYITWTPVGAEELTGIQGRYFIPLALMALSALSHFDRMKHEKIFALCAGTFSVIMTLGLTLTFFYH